MAKVPEKELKVLNDYMKELSKIPLLTPEEEKELARRAKEGDKEAFKKLVESNLRFVISIAKNYLGYGVPLSELIAAGNLGLVEAAKRFDPDKGVKFISYAVWWIRQSIMQVLSQQSSAVKIPLKLSSTISKISRVYNKIFKESEVEPTPYEIAKEISKEDLRKKLQRRLKREPTEEELEEALKKEGFTISPEEVENFVIWAKPYLSTETPIKEGEETSIGQLLLRDTQEDVEGRVMRESLEREIEELLKHLDEKERKIIELRFGFGGEEPKTLKEVGKILNISRERARQLETKALRKLRNLAIKRKLKDYLF